MGHRERLSYHAVATEASPSPQGALSWDSPSEMSQGEARELDLGALIGHVVDTGKPWEGGLTRTRCETSAASIPGRWKCKYLIAEGRAVWHLPASAIATPCTGIYQGQLLQDSS